jgi:hypothetical protein
MTPAAGITFEAPTEFALLLRLLSPQDKAGGAREVIYSGVDWERLVRLAVHHKVLAQLYAVLGSELRDYVPAEAFQHLEEQAHDNARRNLLLTAKLLKLLALFGAEGIRAVPFKGPLLALSAYGDSSMRQFGDLDLLVRPEDVPRARRVLVSQGYAPQFPLTDAQESRLIKFRNEHAFYHEGQGVAVDLHWMLSPRWLHADSNGEGIWSRLQSAAVGGRPVPTLDPNDLLLFLCVHGSKHCWSQLGMVYDVATLLRSAAPDWEALFARARREGSTRMLCLGLHMASTLFRVELPEDVAAGINADPRIKSLAAESCAKLRREPEEPWGQFEELRFNARVIEGLRVKALFYLDALMTPTPLEWEYLTLPERLSFLYYLVRPFRLALKHGKVYSG